MPRKKINKQERLNTLKAELEEQKQKKAVYIQEIDKKIEDLQAEKKTKTASFDNKIKKISSDIEKLEDTISLETMKNINNVISLKGISMNELLTALQTGDLLSLQEQMETSLQNATTTPQAEAMTSVDSFALTNQTAATEDVESVTDGTQTTNFFGSNIFGRK